MPKLPLVHLTWVDSCSTRGWQEVDTKDPIATMTSVGLLVGETDDAYIISTSRSHIGRVMDQLAIPKCAVKRMRKLGPIVITEP